MFESTVHENSDQSLAANTFIEYLKELLKKSSKGEFDSRYCSSLAHYNLLVTSWHQNAFNFSLVSVGYLHHECLLFNKKFKQCLNVTVSENCCTVSEKSVFFFFFFPSGWQPCKSWVELLWICCNFEKMWIHQYAAAILISFFEEMAVKKINMDFGVIIVLCYFVALNCFLVWKSKNDKLKSIYMYLLSDDLEPTFIQDMISSKTFHFQYH